jgi:AmmeMemoRadiSam system protein B
MVMYTERCKKQPAMSPFCCTTGDGFVMDNPKLRELEVFLVSESGRKMIGLRDPLNFSSDIMAVPQPLYLLLTLLDGHHSIVDIQAEYMLRHGELIYRETIEQILEKLDACLFLDNENFCAKREEIENAFRQADTRPATITKRNYNNSLEKLTEQIDGFFTHHDGPGPIETEKAGTSVKGIIAPHIDFQRGGPCFAWAYKELSEKADADVFIIFGTAHARTEETFVATYKDFETPFGIVPCERDLLKRIENEVSGDLFKDEFVHRGEHSIEFQSIFLGYLFNGRRNISIVPILCGSFHELIASRTSPMDNEVVADFVAAVKSAVAGYGKKVAYVAGADLAHVGPRFGDPHPISDDFLKLLEADDLRMLASLQKADAEGFFSAIQSDGDRRKICGLPPIYTMLSVMQPGSGKLLKYQQWPDPEGTVTFASLSFD